MQAFERKCLLRTIGALVSLCLMTAASGCGDDAPKTCSSPEILPHHSPVVLGEMWPLGSETAQPATNERVPYEWVLLLQNQCDELLKIDTVCLVGEGIDNYIIEGPVPNSVKRGEPGAVRLTYNRTDPGGPDNVALYVKSNASDFPSLIVPVCASVVADGQEKATMTCDSPVKADDAFDLDTTTLPVKCSLRDGK